MIQCGQCHVIIPDAGEEEEHGHVPGVHADYEPETGPVPALDVLWEHLDVVREPGGVDQDSVVQEDAPGQHNSDQINVRSPGALLGLHRSLLLGLPLHLQFCWFTFVILIHFCICNL